MLNIKLKPILLVEDDDVDAMTVERAIKELKVKNELIRSTNGEDALKYLRNPINAKPCITLLDLNMPKMNGIEFLKAVKADNKLKDIPVVVMAASNEEKDIVETFNLGVAGYIFKPVDSKKLDEFKPLKLYWTVEQKKGVTVCLLLLLYMIVVNSGYNLWVAKENTPVWKYFVADVIRDLWIDRTTTTKIGTVVGILYSEEKPCALINLELVHEGDVRNGIKIVRIDKDEVEFGRNGERWTQKVLANPNPVWKTTKSLPG